jgi:hypothetical protein
LAGQKEKNKIEKDVGLSNTTASRHLHQLHRVRRLHRHAYPPIIGRDHPAFRFATWTPPPSLSSFGGFLA